MQKGMKRRWPAIKSKCWFSEHGIEEEHTSERKGCNYLDGYSGQKRERERN